jgi:hypothetical protein
VRDFRNVTLHLRLDDAGDWEGNSVNSSEERIVLLNKCLRLSAVETPWNIMELLELRPNGRLLFDCTVFKNNEVSSELIYDSTGHVPCCSYSHYFIIFKVL